MKFKKINPKTFEGKKFEMAPANRVEAASEVADDFMIAIFDFEGGGYLITDESSLSDFTEYGSSDMEPLWRRIEARYGIGPSVVRSDKLVDIFEAIVARQRLQ